MPSSDQSQFGMGLPEQERLPAAVITSSRELGKSLILDTEPLGVVRARTRSLPGARFLKECRGEQGDSRGDLSGRVRSCMLKPPGDGFHKDREHKVCHHLI